MGLKILFSFLNEVHYQIVEYGNQDHINEAY